MSGTQELQGERPCNGSGFWVPALRAHAMHARFGRDDSREGIAHVKRISRRRFLKALGLSGAGMVGLSSYGLAVEPMWRLEVTRYRVTPPNWPRDLKLSIGVIADVHAGGPAMPAGRIRGIV